MKGRLASVVQQSPVCPIDGALLTACCAYDLRMSVTCQSIDSLVIYKLAHADIYNSLVVIDKHSFSNYYCMQKHTTDWWIFSAVVIDVCL